jgi:hypothetical protein
MGHLRQVGFALLALLLVSSAASAQRPRARSAPAGQRALWELGFDSELAFGLDAPRVTLLRIPVASFRAGYWASDVLSIEPFFSLTSINGQGGGSFSTYQLGVGGLYHFSPNRLKRQFYVRPFLDFIGASGGGASTSDVGFGVGGGVKWPKLGGRIALRGEANVHTINSQSAIDLLFGLSLFTR